MYKPTVAYSKIYTCEDLYEDEAGYEFTTYVENKSAVIIFYDVVMIKNYTCQNLYDDELEFVVTAYVENVQ